MHWAQRAKMKSEFEELAFWSAKKSGLPKLTEPVEIFITYYHPKQTVDLDNYTPKFFLDALKQFFVDDNFLYLVKLGWTFKKGTKRSVVEISLAQEK